MLHYLLVIDKRIPPYGKVRLIGKKNTTYKLLSMYCSPNLRKKWSFKVLYI